MADILSQDEIDRLLNVAGPEPAAEESQLAAEELDAVEKLTKFLVASANSTLGALLAHPTQVKEGLGQVVPISALELGKSVLALLPFRSGFEGQLAFHLQFEDASVLADLILGGAGTAKETLEDADTDALKEALSQIAGSGSPSMSSALNREVGFGPPEVKVIEQGTLSEALPWGNAFLGIGTITVKEFLDAPLRIMFSVSVAQEMAQLMREGSEPVRSAPVFPAQEVTRDPSTVISPPSSDIRNIELILDIEVEVMVRLGEAVMPLKDIQRLRPGSIIDLDKDTDAPVDLVVNDRVIARGELVVVGSDHFALRITEIETPVERIRRLGPSS